MPKADRTRNRPVPRRFGFAAGLLLPLAIMAFSFVFSGTTDAQSPPGGSTDLLNQLQQRLGGLGQNGASDNSTSPLIPPISNLPTSTTLQPVPPNLLPPLPPSRLEEIMSSRAGARLQQFGYDQLGHGDR